jgi:hypothetical protein
MPVWLKNLCLHQPRKLQSAEAEHYLFVA